MRKGTHVLAHIEPNLPDDVKVTGELLRVLYKAQIREMRNDGTWPRAFDDSYDDAMDDDVAGGGAHGVDVQRGALEGLSIGGAGSGGDDDDDEDDDDLPPLAANRNRRPLRREVESSSESEDGEEKEEEEEGDDSSDED